MTASDHLSPVQFMDIADVGKMQSVNLNGRYGSRGDTVDDWDHEYRDYHGGQTYDADIAANGVREPLEIGIAATDKHRDVLYDGHHRYSSAKHAGLRQVPVVTETSWTRKPKSQPEPEAGQ
jgi:hypothetical protein